MERENLGDLDGNIRTGLKPFLRKQGMQCWGGINLLRIKSDDGGL